MAAPFFTAWREQRRLKRAAAAYVQGLLAEPDAEDVDWLSAVATGGDVDRARWELRYARRAAGLLSAERDALDDRTASAVAHELDESWAGDRNIAAGMRHIAERQFNARLAALGHAIGARSSPEPTGTRIGRALLMSAGAMAPAASETDRAGAIVARYLELANESLRRLFGTATLPENIPPSAAQRATGTKGPGSEGRDP
ncbi:MAG TPA: hypothetical protein VFZ21_27650 [Gemmatimonadaceae bacterium]|nr:hypothetical protein [Gemmatimonadaceae bacterium]